MDLLRKRLWMNRPTNEFLQLTFLNRLHRLLVMGYSLIDALDLLRWDKQLAPFVTIIKAALKEGAHLDEAFSAAKFHQLIIVYLYFVRVNGDIITSLGKGIKIVEQRFKTLQKFKRVSRYPFILLFIFILLLYFIKTYIFPSYVEMFHFNGPNAYAIPWMIQIFDVILTLFFMLLIVSFVIALWWYFYKDKLSITYRLKIYNNIPVVRTFIKLQTSFYFATHMSICLQTSLSMKHMMEYMINQKELPILSHYATLMLHHLSKGYYLNDLIVSLPFLDDHLAFLFQKNNNASNLQKDLTAYADVVAENLEHKIMRTITFFQPIFFIILGSFIVFIYVSLLFPMFQIIQTV